MKIRDLVSNKESFFKLIQCYWDSPKKSYSFYKFYTEAEKEILFFERERAKLAKQFGESKDGTIYSIKEENKSMYLDELNKVLDTDVEIINPEITIEDVSNVQYTGDKSEWISPVEMYKLESFLNKFDNKKENA